MANGHPNAGLYPLGLLNDEASLVIERENGRIATEGVVFQAAAVSVMATDGGKYFNDVIARLNGE